MLNTTIRCTALLSAVLCAACAREPLRLYEGAPRPAAEVATLTVPEALEVSALDGREVRGASGMMRGGDLEVELAPGRHELLVFYREIWQRNGDHDTLKSDPALFAVDAQAGHRYRLDFERPRRYEDAQVLSRDFKGWVADESTGQRVDSTASGLQFRKGLVAELTGNNTLTPAVAGGSKVAPAAAAAPAPTPATETGAPPATATPGDWLLLIKGWWSQASADERREFLRWVGEQAAAKPD